MVGLHAADPGVPMARTNQLLATGVTPVGPRPAEDRSGVVRGWSGRPSLKWRGRRWHAAAGLGLAVILAIAGCGNANPQPIINGTTLIGTWVGPDGATMNFTADWMVVVRNLNLGFVGHSSTCRSVSAEGTWQFDSPQGNSGSSPLSYAKSDIIEIDFPASQPITICNSQFTTWEVNSPLRLCLYLDPDTPCGSNYTLIKQHSTKRQ
jgi:hypothetical protein